MLVIWGLRAVGSWRVIFAMAAMRLSEIHRFPNQPAQEAESLRWIWRPCRRPLRSGSTRLLKRGWIIKVSAVILGVDYVLYDAQGQRMQPAFRYRDPRTARGVKTILNRMPWESICRIRFNSCPSMPCFSWEPKRLSDWPQRKLCWESGMPSIIGWGENLLWKFPWLHFQPYHPMNALV